METDYEQELAPLSYDVQAQAAWARHTLLSSHPGTERRKSPIQCAISPNDGPVPKPGATKWSLVHDIQV